VGLVHFLIQCLHIGINVAQRRKEDRRVEEEIDAQVAEAPVEGRGRVSAELRFHTSRGKILKAARRRRELNPRPEDLYTVALSPGAKHVFKVYAKFTLAMIGGVLLLSLIANIIDP
jgi:hypothetical protein